MRSLLLAVVLIGAPGLAHADETARVEQLENRVAVLEKQVARLLDQLTDSPRKSGGAQIGVKDGEPDGSPDLTSWRKLRKGMSKDQVIELLGQPVVTEHMAARRLSSPPPGEPAGKRGPPTEPASELWLYGELPPSASRVSRGWIEENIYTSFVKFDESEKVKVWREPRRR